jgi:hypothetical protein
MGSRFENVFSKKNLLPSLIVLLTPHAGTRALHITSHPNSSPQASPVPVSGSTKPSPPPRGHQGPT